MESRSRVLRHVSARIRQARLARQWTQQSLADRADVSRRMLGAIEGGETNVSLATLDRIATALDIPFAELVRDPSAKPGTRSSVVAWRGKRRGSRAKLLLAGAASRSVELWSWNLAPGERYQAEPDPSGMQEFIYVVAGALILETGDGRRRLRAGDAVAFPSDQTYAYLNEGAEVVHFVKNVVS